MLAQQDAEKVTVLSRVLLYPRCIARLRNEIFQSRLSAPLVLSLQRAFREKQSLYKLVGDGAKGWGCAPFLPRSWMVSMMSSHLEEMSTFKAGMPAIACSILKLGVHGQAVSF